MTAFCTFAIPLVAFRAIQGDDDEFYGAYWICSKVVSLQLGGICVWTVSAEQGVLGCRSDCAKVGIWVVLAMFSIERFMGKMAIEPGNAVVYAEKGVYLSTVYSLLRI